MLTDIIRLMNNNKVTINKIDFKVGGDPKVTLRVTYTNKDTNEQRVSHLPYSNFHYANMAHDKLIDSMAY